MGEPPLPPGNRAVLRSGVVWVLRGKQKLSKQRSGERRSRWRYGMSTGPEVAEAQRSELNSPARLKFSGLRRKGGQGLSLSEA